MLSQNVNCQNPNVKSSSKPKCQKTQRVSLPLRTDSGTSFGIGPLEFDIYLGKSILFSPGIWAFEFVIMRAIFYFNLAKSRYTRKWESGDTKASHRPTWSIQQGCAVQQKSAFSSNRKRIDFSLSHRQAFYSHKIRFGSYRWMRSSHLGSTRTEKP